MSPIADQVLQAARALSEDERKEIIEALLGELDPTDEPPLDEAWLAEIQRRSAAFDAGQVTPIPWSEVKAPSR